MPKIIELTLELEVQRVSCPGVWLCQDGRVSLTVFLLGTSYQTCMLPPVFPLMFKDVFYFRKRFQESCALSNICCTLKDETIYCELVQWSDNCYTGNCTVLAQYLGALNDILFPPNMCSTDGVDLLMRRAKEFPGILSPKIEIATKVRIDEVWDQPCHMKPMRVTSCHCTKDLDSTRQKQVCHSAQYHRTKCNMSAPAPAPGTRSRSRSRSQSSSRSCTSFTPPPPRPEPKISCECSKHLRPPSPRKSRASLFKSRGSKRKCEYDVYNVNTFVTGNKRPGSASSDYSEIDGYDRQPGLEKFGIKSTEQDTITKSLLESRYIDDEPIYQSKLKERERKHFQTKLFPCVCEICKKYHELFHSNESRIEDCKQ